jgi:transposase-like protein
VEELKSGISAAALSRKYGITGANTIRRWVERYGNPGMLNSVIYVKMKHEADELKCQSAIPLRKAGL